MKKINTILAAVSALLMLTVTSANSVEFKAGASVNQMAAYANAKETLKDSNHISNEEALLATSFASVFAEVSSDAAMGLGIGISYAPEVVDLNKETRHVAQAVSGEGDTDGVVALLQPASRMPTPLALASRDTRNPYRSCQTVPRSLFASQCTDSCRNTIDFRFARRIACTFGIAVQSTTRRRIGEDDCYRKPRWSSLRPERNLARRELD